jgi:crotonobetainyl-CoA:carnitine CoA-transferase CaiB-like acyl-CoA transferase
MEFLENYFKARSLKDALAFLAPLDVCYAPVNTLPEGLEAAADKLLVDKLGRRHLAPPIRFRDEPARPDLHEPRLGEHDALKKNT